MTAAAIPALLMAMSAAPQTSRAADDDTGRVREVHALRAAASAPLGDYIIGFQPDQHKHIALRNPSDRTLTAVFYYGDRPALRVVVDEAEERLIEQTILRRNGAPARPVGKVEALVRASSLLGRWLARHETAWLAPQYDPDRDQWLVTVHLDSRPVGTVVVAGDSVLGEGPWQPTTPTWSVLHDAWLRLRLPVVPFGWIAILLVAAFVGLMLDPRRLRSWRTLDVALFVLIAAAQIRVWRVASDGYILFMIGTVLLLVRLAWRAARPSPGTAPNRLHAAVPLLVLLAVLVWQADNVPAQDFWPAEEAALLRGARVYRTGAIGYGESEIGYDTYGPVHYLAYGWTHRWWPCGLPWDVPESEIRHRPMNFRGAAVVGFGVQVLAVAAIAGIGRRLTGRWRHGLTLAAAYLVLAVASGRFFSSSQYPPSTLVLLSVLTWPNPVGAALFLGLATADMWFPILLLPLWLGSVARRRRLMFAVAYLIVGLVFLGVALHGAGSLWSGIRGLWRGVLLQQVHNPGHGTGFWDLFPRGTAVTVIRGVLAMATLVLCAAAWRWRRPSAAAPAARLRRLIVVTAVLLASTQLWKYPHGPEYIGWYLPFALLALFCPDGGHAASAPAAPRAADLSD